MSNTATLAADGLYDLSPAIKPFDDDLTFARVAVISSPSIGTYVFGVGVDGCEHPDPVRRSAEVTTPADALAALGYTLA